MMKNTKTQINTSFNDIFVNDKIDIKKLKKYIKQGKSLDDIFKINKILDYILKLTNDNIVEYSLEISNEIYDLEIIILNSIHDFVCSGNKLDINTFIKNLQLYDGCFTTEYYLKTILKTLENNKLIIFDVLYKLLQSVKCLFPFEKQIIKKFKGLKLSYDETYMLLVLQTKININDILKNNINSDVILSMMSKYEETSELICFTVVNRFVELYLKIGNVNQYEEHINIYNKYIELLGRINVCDSYHNYLHKLINIFNLKININDLKAILKLDKKIYITTIVTKLIDYNDSNKYNFGHNIKLDEECIELILDNNHHIILIFIINQYFNLTEQQMIQIIQNDKCYVREEILYKYITNGGVITSELFNECMKITNFLKKCKKGKKEKANSYKYDMNKDMYDQINTNISYEPKNTVEECCKLNLSSKCINMCINSGYIPTQTDFENCVTVGNINILMNNIKQLLKHELKLSNELLTKTIKNNNINNTISLIELGVVPNDEDLNNLFSMSITNEILENILDILTQVGIDINSHILYKYCTYLRNQNSLFDNGKYVHSFIKGHKIIPDENLVDILCDSYSYPPLFKYLVSINVKFSIQNLKDLHENVSKKTFSLILNTFEDT